MRAEQCRCIEALVRHGTALHFHFHCFAMKVKEQALTHCELVGVSTDHCTDCSASLTCALHFAYSSLHCPIVPLKCPLQLPLNVTYSSLQCPLVPLKCPTVQLQFPIVSIHYLTVHFQFAYSLALKSAQHNS